MERPKESVWLKSRKPGGVARTPGAPGSIARPATWLPRLVVLRALNISRRSSKPDFSVNRKRLAMEKSTLSSPGANSVFLPTVRALGGPLLSTKCTVFGSMQTRVRGRTAAASGLEKPVGHQPLPAGAPGFTCAVGANGAHAFRVAPALLMSGRAGTVWPSPLRSKPFATVNG